MHYTKRKEIKRNKVKLGKNEFIFILNCISVILGSILGIMFGLKTGDVEFNKLSVYINDYMNVLNKDNLHPLNIFLDCFFQYGKIVFIIWILGFMPPGIVVVLIVLCLKGMSFSFTNVIFIRIFGFQGFLYCLKLIYVQNLLLILLLLYVSYYSIQFAVDSITEYTLPQNKYTKASLRHKNKFRIKYLFMNSLYFDRNILKNYLLVLCVGIMGVFVMSVVEGYILRIFY